MPDERISYKVVGGIPVRSHTGVIEFSDDPAAPGPGYTMDSIPSCGFPHILTKVLDTLMGQMIGSVKRAVAGELRDTRLTTPGKPRAAAPPRRLLGVVPASGR